MILGVLYGPKQTVKISIFIEKFSVFPADDIVLDGGGGNVWSGKCLFFDIMKLAREFLSVLTILGKRATIKNCKLTHEKAPSKFEG